MKSWTKPLGILVAAAALVLAGAAHSAGTGSAQAPAKAAASEPAAQSPRIHPKIVSDSVADEAVLTPIVPCRAVDTREGGGRVASPSIRSFLIEGTGDFSSQGGPTHGCAIPNNATALAVVLTAVNPSKLGYLKAYPFGTPAPASSVIDYAHQTTSSGATVAITPNTAKGLTIFNFGGSTDVLVDITGYYQPQIEADILTGGTFFSHSTRVLSVSHVAGTGSYAVTVDRSVEGPCSPVVSPTGFGIFATAITQPGGVIDVETFHLVGGAAKSLDSEFDLVVSC